MPITCRVNNARVYRGKNGYTSTSVKVKSNQGYTWKKNSSTPRPKKKK